MSVTYYDLFGPAQIQQPSGNTLIEWGDHLSINHPEIDAQHKAIFDLGATIYESWRSGAKVGVLRTAVDELASLLEAHFSYEERLLARAGYDGLDEHAAEHRRMLNELNNMQERFHAPGTENETCSDAALAPGWPVMKLILGFTIAHVMTSDMSYSEALRASRNQIYETLRNA